MRRLVLYALVATLAAATHALESPHPRHQKVLGAATYITMPVNKLASPTLLWADFDFLLQRGILPNQTLAKFAFASPVEGESAAVYRQEFVTAYVDGNGGTGMNGNFGSGRAAIIQEDWQIKGSGPTAMVNPNADGSHRNGASFIAEGIHEAIWGRLLAYELPYGAFRTVALIATGSHIGRDSQPRVLIVREDPLRPGHYVINPTAEALGDPRDAARIKEAMEHILDALPSPPGDLPVTAALRFMAKVNEFIDRQAIQHGYAWAHSLFHGATSPSNAGMDGRMIDFGTFSAFDGYPKVRVIDEDGFFGDTSTYQRDLLKNIRDSWVRTLPKILLAGLPSEAQWFERFEMKYQKTRQIEMLRLAGSFTEFGEELLTRPQGQNLAQILLQLAEAGNDKEIEVWKGENPFGAGTYNLKEILSAAASESLAGFSSELPNLKRAIHQDAIRKTFADAYLALFRLQQTLAFREGISAEAEWQYRLLASKIRNNKMTTVFRTNENESVIWALINKYKENGFPQPIRQYIDRAVAENRREFRDAAAYTLVLKENQVGYKTERIVFNALTGQTTRVSSGGQTVPQDKCESMLERTAELDHVR